MEDRPNDRPSYWKPGDPVPFKVIRNPKYTIYVYEPEKPPTQAQRDELYLTLAKMLRKNR